MRVTEVGLARKRIGLTMRSDDGASAKEDRNADGSKRPQPMNNEPRRSGKPSRGTAQAVQPSDGEKEPGSFGSALLKAMKKR